MSAFPVEPGGPKLMGDEGTIVERSLDLSHVVCHWRLTIRKDINLWEKRIYARYPKFAVKWQGEQNIKEAEFEKRAYQGYLM